MTKQKFGLTGTALKTIAWRELTAEEVERLRTR